MTIEQNIKICSRMKHLYFCFINLLLILVSSFMYTACTINSESIKEDYQDKSIMELSNNVGRPDYLFFETVGDTDLYMDTDKNIFMFKDKERKILIEGHSPTLKLSEIFERNRYVNRPVKDKEGNLYYSNNNLDILMIDQNLNVEKISGYHCGFDIIDGVLFYKDDSNNLIKYQNGNKEIHKIDGNRGFLDKIDNTTFMLSYRHEIGDSNERYFEFKNNELREINLDIKYSAIFKNRHKKLQIVEKINNYVPNKKYDNNLDLKSYCTDAEVNSNNNIELKKRDKEILHNYLFFNDDGTVNYYYDGKKVSGMLVFVEGNIDSNKGPICFADTYAYYFGPGGNAMPSGKITPHDLNKFKTDSAYRILKECDFVYKHLIKSNKYELFNDYFLMGRYEQDGIDSNGKEDIKWIVLMDNSKEVLLLSKYVIDYRKINNEFLNVEFYNEAFSEDEKDKIVSKNGIDKVLLIDEDILKRANDNYRNSITTTNKNLVSAIATNVAINEGIETIKEDTKYYHHGSYLIAENKIVKPDGSVMNSLDAEAKYGFRPAVWVKKE